MKIGTLLPTAIPDDLLSWIRLSDVFDPTAAQGNPNEITFSHKGRKVLHLRAAQDPNGPGAQYPTFGEDQFLKAIGRFVDPLARPIVEKIGIYLANSQWRCVALHQRPDGHFKMEWVNQTSCLLTFNLYVEKVSIG